MTVRTPPTPSWKDSIPNGYVTTVISIRQSSGLHERTSGCRIREGETRHEEKTYYGKPDRAPSWPDYRFRYFCCFSALIHCRLLKGFYLRFYQLQGIRKLRYGGTEKLYQTCFPDSRVGHSYLFTFKYAIVSTIVVNVISLILALGLNSKIKAKSALRAIYFIPNILGGLVSGLYLQFLLYIHPARTRRQAAGIEWLSGSMLSNDKTGMDRHCGRRLHGSQSQ